MTCKTTDSETPYGVREAFRIFGASYQASHHLTRSQEKALFSISDCKTGELGYNVSYCPECGYTRIHACSCNNRNCPSCQYPQEQKWIAERVSEIIPDTAYYHLVFTVPHELNDLIEANQKQLLGLLFQAASKTILTLCADKKWLGATPGIILVLHTWGQTLSYHPHIHTIVTGGGLTRDQKFIRGPHKGFFIPDSVIAPVFRGKYLQGLKSLYQDKKLVFPDSMAKLQDEDEWKRYLDRLYGKKWLPFIKETFNGNGNAVRYLARYAYRTAISNNRIDSVDDDGVTFHYKDYADNNRQKTMTMAGEEFIGAFLRHVLPNGFHRVRFAGFLANNVRSQNLTLIYEQLNRVYHGNPVKGKKTHDLFLILFHRDIDVCPWCGGQLRHERYKPRDELLQMQN